MFPMTAGEIATAVGGTLLSGRAAASISAVSTDSRTIEPGALFVAWVGERFDGHDFIASAASRGAAGCLVSKAPAERSDDFFCILVDDTRTALLKLAAHVRNAVSIPFVQITGSVGKTTTKELLSSVLSTHFCLLKTEGNFNNDIGAPLTVLRLKPEHQAAVIETGMNHAGEIRYLSSMVRPDIAVITNIGDAHIEHLGSREGILRAKLEITEYLRPEGLLVLNGDDALLDTVEGPWRILRCGRGEHCDVRVGNIADHGVDGVCCDISSGENNIHVTIPAPGVHMVYPAAIAAGIAWELGLSDPEIVHGIESYRPVGSRMNVLHLPGQRILLDDCYNANPQSVAAALDILAHSECAQRIAILGDMGELGDLTAQAHYNMGALAAMLGLDLVIAIGEKARNIASGVSESGGSVRYYPDLVSALPELAASFLPDTAVLVKASHAMNFPMAVKTLRESVTDA